MQNSQFGQIRPIAIDLALPLLHNTRDLKPMRHLQLSSFVKTCLALFLFLAPYAASVEPAFADLRVCNQTRNPINIALGYRAERGWQSEGWWLAGPNDCATVYQGDLDSRFYYLFAADDVGGGAWDGSIFMCTRDETFTIFGVEDCLARGYERTGFFEVDTQNRTEWTLQLTEKEITGSQSQ